MAEKIWVLGSGTFGVRAVRQLSGIHGARQHHPCGPQRPGIGAGNSYRYQ